MKTKGRDILKKEPKEGREMMYPFDEMDRMFDTMLHGGWLRPFSDWRLLGERESELWTPRIDMVDRENEILVRAELPGVEKKDLEVNLSGNTLTIKGETHRETKEGKDEYYRSEIVHGSFSRTIGLPEEVTGEEVKADFKDGILEIRLPKTQKAERRNITIE